MPFVDPQTVDNPTSAQPAKAAWGDAVRDASVYLATGKPSCRVYNDANISISTASNTVLTFNSERFDTASMHSTSSNTSRITVPTGEGGKYLIGGSVSFAAHATGERWLAVLLNGTTTALARVRLLANQVGSATTDLSISTMYQLSAGDYVELEVRQTSGGNLNVLTSGNISPEFYAMWMAT